MVSPYTCHRSRIDGACELCTCVDCIQSFPAKACEPKAVGIKAKDSSLITLFQADMSCQLLGCEDVECRRGRTYCAFPKFCNGKANVYG